MAGLLNTEPEAAFAGETELVATIRTWATTDCDPFPCGREVWGYASRVSRVRQRPLPSHRSRRAVESLLREKGGLVAYAGELMGSLGWSVVDTAARGDVGVVDIVAMGLTCAICVEPARDGAGDALWMARGDRRVLVVTAPHSRAWRVPCPRH